jgi:hypothetical protein
MTADLAARILAAISEQRLAARFIEGYAKQFERAELIVHKERNRELELILEREILLAMLARIAHTLEGDARAHPRGRTREKPLVADTNRFLRELVASIGRERGWTAGDSMEILSELSLYRAIMAKNSAPVARASGGVRLGSGFRRGANAGPFVDRCAFVLDPSMMENARVSSAKTLREIESLADQLLEECVRSSRTQK